MEELVAKTKILMGENVTAKLAMLPMKRVYIICDPYMKESRKVDEITDMLTSMNAEYSIYAEVIPDPTIAVVTEAVKAMKKFKPDTVIAFGGGSSIDTAKAVGFLYTGMSEAGKPCFIAIPTTSGTGSEVTSFAVISDPETNAKYPLINEDMLPDIAVLDPVFTLTVPPHITADTGLDVLTHALEAYVSVDACDFSDAYAEKAVRIVWQHLATAVKNGADMDARMRMHNASCMAGIAFNQASLGICHSLAHALGARFHISHGRSNAILLPHVISYNAGLENNAGRNALSRYAEIARILGIWASSETSLVHLLIGQIKNLMKRVGVSFDLTETGVSKEEFIAAIPDMAEKALADRCTATNPVVPDMTALEGIYRQLIKGGS